MSVDALTRTLGAAISRAGVIAAQRAVSSLRAHAREMGWPEQAVGNLWVEFVDGSFVPQYPQHAREVIENLEYGTNDTPPVPALRTWANRSQDEMADQHDEVLGAAILASGVLV